MYRVMLIDDEEFARNLMKASIDWKALDMEVVGEASSGIEAINIIDEVRPDIAFVDISMPFMNGIEFSEIAGKRYPHLVLIIMTAFDDFEYARKCVSLPISEYMLKPIVRADVTEVLQKVKARLDSQPAYNDYDSGEGMNAEPDNSAMEQIKKYIKENYTDSKLNLTEVSGIFGFSSSYLSRKFKQETGMNFVEYLTECRMENAKALAAADKKMFVVANEVGIPDPNYFSRCFKKYTGLSYSEYIKENL